MKTFLVFLFTILSLGLNAQTVFAPKGAVWNYDYESDDTKFNLKYQTEKDTIFEGKLCSKVIGERRYISGATSKIGPTYFYTSGDTVLYYYDSIVKFTPLYIFNVKVGDTITILAPSWHKASPPIFKNFITKIETNIVGGIPLKTVFTEPIDTHYFLFKYTERIGGYTVANIIGIDATKTGMHSEGIRCYRDNDIEEKFVSDTHDCDYVPNAISEHKLQNQISIYPNPAQQILFIESKMPNVSILIQTIEGKIVVQKTISSGKNSVDISGFAKGVYFIKVNSEANSYFQKLIVAQ